MENPYIGVFQLPSSFFIHKITKMTNYRYQYELHPAKKGTCPACNHPNKFRFMYDTLTGERLPAQFGKCDRVNNCGYQLFPNKDNYSQHYLNKSMYNSLKLSKFMYNNSISTTTSKPSTHLSFVDESLVLQSKHAYSNNNFALWLYSLFGKEVAVKLLQTYEIGTSKNNGTLFWYRDFEQRYRTAKKIVYRTDGHRDKSINPYYIHNKLAKNQDYEYKLCFFGEHLLCQPENIEKTVAIVESEKSVIIASVYLAHLNFVWLACGGADGLTESKMQVLKNRKIILVPDLDVAGRTAFNKKAAYYEQNGYSIKVYDISPQINDGSDIADFLVAEDLKSKANESQNNETKTDCTCDELITSYFYVHDSFFDEVSAGKYPTEDIYDEFIAHAKRDIPFEQFKISLAGYITSNTKKEFPF